MLKAEVLCAYCSFPDENENKFFLSAKMDAR